jgi:peptidyl-tRNA hydrolase
MLLNGKNSLDGEKMSEYVQYIVVRKDLVPEMGIGKTAAQVGHASVSTTSEILLSDRNEDMIDRLNICQWLYHSNQSKIVVYVKTKQKLLNLSKKLDNLQIRNKLIYDCCFTVFQPEETDGTILTCMGVVPIKRDDVPKCLKELRLLE